MRPAALAQGSDPAPGEWGQKAPLLEPNSEFTLASTGGKIYVLGGYPAGRVSVKTVQIYDIAADSWARGPDLPEVNNHGVAAAHDGVIYLFGGQTDPNTAYVDTVYALDTKQGADARLGAEGERCRRSAAPGRLSSTRTRSTSPAAGRRAATTSPSTIRRPTRGKRCRTCRASATTSRPS